VFIVVVAVVGGVGAAITKLFADGGEGGGGVGDGLTLSRLVKVLASSESTLTDNDVELADSPDDAPASAQVTVFGHPQTPPTPTFPSYINEPGHSVVLLTFPAEQYTYDLHCVPSFNE
jgi:hypothetical protein